MPSKESGMETLGSVSVWTLIDSRRSHDLDGGLSCFSNLVMLETGGKLTGRQTKAEAELEARPSVKIQYMFVGIYISYKLHFVLLAFF